MALLAELRGDHEAVRILRRLAGGRVIVALIERLWERFAQCRDSSKTPRAVQGQTVLATSGVSGYLKSVAYAGNIKKFLRPACYSGNGLFCAVLCGVGFDQRFCAAFSETI